MQDQNSPIDRDLLLAKAYQTFLSLFCGSHPTEDDIDNIVNDLAKGKWSASSLFGDGNRTTFVEDCKKAKFPPIFTEERDRAHPDEDNLFLYFAAARKRMAAIQAARGEYSKLAAMGPDTDFEERHTLFLSIRRTLAEQKADWSSMDASKSSSAEMVLDEIGAAELTRRAEALRQARKMLADLRIENRPSNLQAADRIQEVLNMAGFGPDYLDHSWKPGEGMVQLMHLVHQERVTYVQALFRGTTSDNPHDLPYSLPPETVLAECQKYHITLGELYGHPDMPESQAQSLFDHHRRIWNLRYAFFLDIRTGHMPFMHDTIKQHLTASQLASEVSDCSSDSTNALMPFLDETERQNAPAATKAHLARLRQKYLDR